MSLNKILILLKEVLNEIGDLKKIPSFSYNQISDDKYSFDISQNLRATVEFEKDYDSIEDDSLFQKLTLPDYINKNNIVNLSYSINGEDTQATTTNYTTLIKILKTVSDILIDWVEKNKDIKAISIFAANKDVFKYLDVSDPQKDALYHALVIKNINKLSGKWNFKRTAHLLASNIKGIVLYKVL